VDRRIAEEGIAGVTQPISTRPDRSFWRSTFSSLKVPNYRLYFAGQSISLAGTWMQMTAQSWLVLVLTRSSTDLGPLVALQTLPVLLLAPYGGVVADRVDKRKLMIGLQTAMGCQALVLGLLTVLGSVQFWQVCLLAMILGLNNAFENSARQAFVREMVGRDKLRNAITLNSVTVNAAPAVGPAIGGVLTATVGVGVCFLANAASFVAVVTSLLIMNTATLRPTPPERRARGQLRAGLRYAPPGCRCELCRETGANYVVRSDTDGGAHRRRRRMPAHLRQCAAAGEQDHLTKSRQVQLSYNARERMTREIRRQAAPEPAEASPLLCRLKVAHRTQVAELCLPVGR